MVSTANPAHASVRARGAATQTRILEKAVHIASVEGLSSMSLATLAKATSMSKSGLFAHFRSKEALQIAVIEEAERIFSDTVVSPAQAAGPGVERLAALLTHYVSYCARGPFEGGCFFAAAAHEFDGRPGPVRDRVAAFFENWSRQIRGVAHEAQALGQLRGDVDIGALVFEVHGLGLAANFAAQLQGGSERARQQGGEAIAALLRRVKLVAA